jgi:hypothetical protein
MMCCKCWHDAHDRAYSQRRSQAECYKELVEERKGVPCTPQEHAGPYWDEERQIDTRGRSETDG